MGLMDLFKAKENEGLKKEVDKLNSLLTPEHADAKNMLDLIEELSSKKTILEKELSKLEITLTEVNEEIKSKKDELIILNDEVLMQEFGLYRPMYDFANSSLYKDRLDRLRETQKSMVKEKTAASYSNTWTVDGSLAKGKKMVSENVTQILRSFNIDCENAIDKVKFNNMDSMKKRIEASYDKLNKLNKSMSISIKNEYLNLKLEELKLSYEYQLKKQEEKEEARRIKEELKEEARIRKELEDAKQNVIKDLKHFNNALKSLESQLSDNALDEDKKKALLDKKAELEEQINTLESNLSNIDYRQSNQKAGYVYIISNIGAFGENVYKIGMTRRLEPLDRVNELGDASVPFKFDVHAMIFTEDAPSLENSLHKAFENKKLNMVNQRREFFNVTIEEIESVVKENFNKTINFVKIPDAEQYRESLKMKTSIVSSTRC